MANPAAMLKTRGGPIIGDFAANNLTKQHIVERLKSIPSYVEAFKKAFPAESDPIVYDNIGKAIAVFEATLITPDAPFRSLAERRRQRALGGPEGRPENLHR